MILGTEGKLSFYFHCLQAAEASNTRECQPIIDADGLVVGVLGAMLKGDWEDIFQSVVEAIEEGRGRLRFSSNQKDHCHGRFSALTVGISHGGGQSVSTIPTPPAFRFN